MMQTKNKSVKKSNEIIQNAIFDFGLKEQALFAYICLIANEEEHIKEGEDLLIHFRICDYNNFFNLNGSGKNYQDVKKSLEKIKEKDTFKIETEKLIRSITLITESVINKELGTVDIYLNKKLIPFIASLKEDYTKVRIASWAKMTSKYSPRLYEYLLSHYCKRISVLDRRSKEEQIMFPMKLDILISYYDLKKRLSIDNKSTYETFSFFEHKILKLAVKEINEFTELIVTYNTRKNGNTVEDIIFTVSKKAEV